jgi:pimeloyl-ACP methyl ester carboxylesterase
MKAIATAGYRAIAPDMRGYGRSSAPPEASLYTPLQTAGDLVGLLDALKIPSAVLVGHDWGATHAWNAALMRPDRFKAVFCLSVPYVPREDVSVFERMRKAGHQNEFYMFEQMRPEADQIWADATVTIPGILYWASGSAPATTRWSPMDPARSLHRPAPGPLPSWAEPDYVEHNVAEFKRTGFHGGLNYYRAAEPYFYLSAAFKGAKVTQPSFLMMGKTDGLKQLYPLTEDQLRVGLPGLVRYMELDNIGHWIQHEASAEVSDQLLKFLQTVSLRLNSSAATANVSNLAAHTFSSPRHTTRYWEAGPPDGPLMIFLHGWPQICLMWRAQMEAFASEGWHCIAPDMRGYGGSSAPTAFEAYALKEIVEDMVELHDHLGAQPAIWIGHDLGSPVAGALAAHHAKRSRGVVFTSVPYSPDSFALPSLLPLIDRKVYPVDQYPDGQWDYYRFYLTHFDQTVTDFNADIAATLSVIYRRGDPKIVGNVYRSAVIARNGGWFGSAHRAPSIPPDPTLWPEADFNALVEAFRVTGFRPGNSWYLNDDANIAYAHSAPDGGRLRQPVLFVNGDFDGICDITRTHLGDPMRNTCPDLTVTSLPAGHWLPLEYKTELVQAIRSWLKTKKL